MSVREIPRCPECKRPMGSPTRICWDCKKPITRHHKWTVGADGRIRHRICSDPEAYQKSRAR